jgi:hypothetical protein
MASKNRKKAGRQTQKVSIKFSLKLILTCAAFSIIIAAGLFIYFNLSHSAKSNAATSVQFLAQPKPVEFEVKEWKLDFKQETLNGINVRKAVEADD